MTYNEKSHLFNQSKVGYGTADSKENGKNRDEAEVKKTSILKLFKYATVRDKWILGIGTISAFIHGAAWPLQALIFGQMTNTFITQFNYGFVNKTEATQHNSTDFFNINDNALTKDEFIEFMAEFAVYYIYVGILAFVASITQAICWEVSCERQTYRLRQEFMYQVLRQETSWFDKHQTGDLASKLSDDLERVREGIGHKFSMVIQYGSTFVSGFLVGFLISWQLTLVILSLTPLLAGTSAFTGRLIATQSAREQKKYGKAGAIAEEVISSIKTVASFSGETREIARYEFALMESLRLAIRKYHVLAVGLAFVFFIMYSSYALAFWYGCQLLLDDLLTPGDIFTVFFSVLVGAFAIGNAVPYLVTVAIAQGSGAVVFEVIDSIPKIDPYSKGGMVPEKIVGNIVFKNVSFRYPSRKEVSILQNFDMEIESGKTVAVVGSSGSGKSTIVNLILRFYDPLSGHILIDGNDTRICNLDWLRNQIGVVSQEPILFGTTIYENIRYGREDVTPAEIVSAACLANAHDFISALPAGYGTMTGERGAQLSGGQKQRIAIARALVRNPTILLMDEATSALDSKSESLVQGALDKARRNRTTIIIAHRLSTIKDADLIYAMKNGVIVETGNHNQLMAKEGHYYELVTAQTSRDVVDELAGDASASYDSVDEDCVRGFFDTERRHRRKTKTSRRKLRLTLPDPDIARLTRETAELNATYPGVWNVLKVNRPEWLILIGGGIGCFIAGIVMPVFAYFYAEMFATFSLSGQELEDASMFWACMFLALAIVSAFGFWMRTILLASAGEYLTMRLRLMSYTGIVRQPLAWFDQELNSAGRLSTRLARDAPLVKAAAGHRLGTFISAITTIVAGLGIAFLFGWRLALAILAAFPILVIAGYIQIQIQKSGQKKDAELMEDAGRIATEAIQNIKTVQAFSIEQLFYEKYLERLMPVYADGHKQACIYGLAFAFSEAIIFFIYAGAFYYGSYLISIDLMEPTNVYRVFFCVAFSAVSVGQATSFIPDYTKANLAAGLIFNLIKTKSKIDPLSRDGLRPILYGRITFNDVYFRYPNRIEYPVLQGLTFDLQPGTTLALVGPSGCGKSTVVSLLERFYDVIGGQIMIDGFDIRTLNVTHLRQLIGLVTQEPLLFDCSIRENIAYGYGDGQSYVPDDLIIEAAIAANIQNFITALPSGYETLVGERGTQLSGGQKQRIAIARALIRNPRILLLDEATSALDTESEMIVQEALDNARTGRTCLIIAHRLSTIQTADIIAVVHGGRIVEMGSHDQLIKARKMYYKLTKKQQITH